MSVQNITEAEKFQSRLADRVGAAFGTLEIAAEEAERLAKMCPKECIKHYKVIQGIGESFLSMSEVLKEYCNRIEQEKTYADQ